MTVTKLNKLWRPYTAIFVGLNIGLQPWVFLFLDTFHWLDANSIHLWIYLYGQECLLFAGLAGIRQFDKNKQHDVLLEMSKEPNTEPNTYEDQFMEEYSGD